jgi:hypothetical protein
VLYLASVVYAGVSLFPKLVTISPELLNVYFCNESYNHIFQTSYSLTHCACKSGATEPPGHERQQPAKPDHLQEGDVNPGG